MARETITGMLIVGLMTCPTASKEQTPSADTPSAAPGNIQSCPTTLRKDNGIHSCKIVGADQNAKALANGARGFLNALVSSPAFRDAVLAANFDPTQMKQCQSKDSCGPQLTKQQIYDLMVKNSPQTINVIFYTHHWPDEGNQGFEDSVPPNTVFGNIGKIGKNQGFLASLMLHEWMHILGFRHDNSTTTCRSVPYEMNGIYATVALNHPELKVPPSASPCSANTQ
jgi:hypothetical protein